MEIQHDIANKRAYLVIDGEMASVEYELTPDSLDILHTRVPRPLEGQGIAARLVSFVYNYAEERGLKRAATCTYAKAWLLRHPENK